MIEDVVEIHLDVGLDAPDAESTVQTGGEHVGRELELPAVVSQIGGARFGQRQHRDPSQAAAHEAHHIAHRSIPLDFDVASRLRFTWTMTRRILPLNRLSPSLYASVTLVASSTPTSAPRRPKRRTARHATGSSR
jgi:hypothetical protein